MLLLAAGEHRGVQGVAGANIWSIFVQDTWAPTSRLTLNLGLRTENEVIPSFKTDIKANAFEFGFGLLRHQTLDTLLEAYQFKDGNIWPLALVVITVAPVIAARLRKP